MLVSVHVCHFYAETAGPISIKLAMKVVDTLDLHLSYILFDYVLERYCFYSYNEVLGGRSRGQQLVPTL